MKLKTNVRAGGLTTVNGLKTVNHSAVKVKTAVRAGGLTTVNGLKTVNHSAVKVKTNVKAGSGNGLKTVNG